MPSSHYFAVYHANDPQAIHSPEASSWYEDRSHAYSHVADVVAPLEQVFALTNHIDHDWTRNQEVIWRATATTLRSTSVGDVILAADSGHAWLILPIGLQDLPLENGIAVGDTATPVRVIFIMMHFTRIVSIAITSLRGHINHPVPIGAIQMMRRIIDTLRGALQMIHHKTPPNDRN